MKSLLQRYRMQRWLLAFGAAGVAVSCMKDATVSDGTCEGHDDCAPNTYCVARSCEAPCSTAEDCSGDQACMPHSALPEGIEVCLPSTDRDASPGGQGGESSGTTGSGGKGTGGSNETTGGSHGLGGSEAECPEVLVPPSFVSCGEGLGGAGGGFGVETNLPHTNGFVFSEDNDYGIQGAYYAFDDGFTLLEPEVFNGAEEGQLCVSGTSAAVLEDKYDLYFGGGMGLLLSSDVGECRDFGTWDATAHGVTGLSFYLRGGPPEHLQLTLATPESINYCYRELHEGLNVISFSDVREDCWNTLPGPSPDPTELIHVQWSIVTLPEESYEFCYCIDGLTALTD